RHRTLLLAIRRDQSRLRSSAGYRPERTAQNLRRRDHGVLMIDLSKRRFVQLAGLSIANRIWPSQLRGQELKGLVSSNKVIIVTFGGGVRYAETFAADGLRNIPRLATMRPEGH